MINVSGSSIGNIFKISTFGESHGVALGVIIDGCPSGILLSEEDIQKELDRRKPGQNIFTTKRNESDEVEILSGVFDGKTTGTPICLVVYNKDQKSKDYSNIKDVFRPGHADMGFELKYGFRDYRGGGRSSGRETVARVAAGAVAKKILKELNIDVFAYTKSIGNIEIKNVDRNFINKNPFCLPDKSVLNDITQLCEDTIQNCDSLGGVIECRVNGLKTGIGEPVFDKLDALLSRSVMSIGAVKGIEFGAGFNASLMTGSENNDSMYCENGKICKKTNNSGGVLGGMSDGSEIVFRAAFKPTPSIAQKQNTVTKNYEDTSIEIKGRHDPLVVPRAVVVVEAMTCIVLVDLILMNLSSKIDSVKLIYNV